MPHNLADSFFAAVHTHPAQTALVFETHRLTYRQLASRVQSLRACLGEQSAAPRIGILAQRSEAAYAGVLASLAEARCYVPLNPAFPAVRNHYIVEKAALSTLIVGAECSQALRALLAETPRALRILTLGRDPEFAQLEREFPGRLEWHVAEADENAPITPPLDCEPASLAYVLFTSGSTGAPKGVCVTHANVLSYVRTLLTLYPVQSSDRLSQTFDLTFDLSVHDMFVCYAAAATLVVYPPSALASPIPYTAAQCVTVWFSVPALAAFLETMRQAEPGALPGVRLSFFCGEKLSWNTLCVWKRVAPNTRVVNLYGPTEATIAITHFEVPDDFTEQQALHGAIPIGRAFPGQRTEVRAEDGSLCAEGQVGALWLAGDQISRGYLDDAGLTAGRFVAKQGEVFYRTGDLVMRSAHDILQFVGREDFQVKIMGYRVELGEVEHALMQASGCALAVAGVAALRDGVDELFAVLPTAAAPEKSVLRKALKRLLPAYMQPRSLLFMDDLPLNANGKIDRAAVAERVARAVAEASAQER